MPYIPHLGVQGSLANFADASVNDVLRRSLYTTPDAPGQQDDFVMRASGLGNFSSVNASAILTMPERHAIQVMATCTSTISLAAAICALYWFAMMRRNFRRDLVLLLIAGGFWKSLWFATFSIVTFAKGPVQTADPFCQAGGYLLQVGFEACDVAVLFMSMHMCLQIFPPSRNSFLGHDGLYRIRFWIYGLWVALPNLSASLAFVNPRAAYMAQGAFCSLPLRPFWYRLSLFWLPRYMIWVYVIYVAVRIYRHVGSEFKVFGQLRPSSSSLGMPQQSSIDRAAAADQERMQQKYRTQTDTQVTMTETEKLDDDDESYAPDDMSGLRKPRTEMPEAMRDVPSNPARRQSTPNWITTTSEFGFGPASSVSGHRTTPNSRRGSHQVAAGVWGEDFAPPLPPIDFKRHRNSITSFGRRSTLSSIDGIPPMPNAVVDEGSASSTLGAPVATANRAMKQRRRAIQRQLRLLFIYPCIYMITWCIPLVVNVMNYTDYFAQHPVYALSFLQIFCLTNMTFVDVVVFCWRERPWRHIPGSDGTFMGSFMWWRYCFGEKWTQERRTSRAPSLTLEKSVQVSASQSQMGLLSSLKRWSMSHKWSTPRGSEGSRGPHTVPLPHKRTWSGGSDKKAMEAERAQERLELERADYERNRQSYLERRASAVSAHVQSPGSERKEWFDKDMDGDLFKDSASTEEASKQRV